MVILRFELESEAMEELEGVDEENKYYIKNKVDHKNTEKNMVCVGWCLVT